MTVTIAIALFVLLEVIALSAIAYRAGYDARLASNRRK
jgi:hypothetical protein